MQNLINHKGIEETIQFIEKQHQYLDEAKTELENYLNYTKQGKFDLSEEGTIDERIKKIESVLDKYEEISTRRIEITKKSEELKKNTDEMMNKVNEMIKFSSNKDDIDEVHDEMVYKLIELEKEKCNKKVEKLEEMLRNKVTKFIDGEEQKQLDQWTNKKMWRYYF